jgi:hypothetical protein
LTGVRPQYHFWASEDGLDAWSVERLVGLTGNLPVKEVELESMTEVDSAYWFDKGPETPTVRRIVEHMRLARHT